MYQVCAQKACLGENVCRKNLRRHLLLAGKGWAEAASGFSACLAPVGHMTTEACPSSVQFGQWLLFHNLAQNLGMANLSQVGCRPKKSCNWQPLAVHVTHAQKRHKKPRPVLWLFERAGFRVHSASKTGAGIALQEQCIDWSHLQKHSEPLLLLFSGWSLGEKGYCVVIHGSEWKIPVCRTIFVRPRLIMLGDAACVCNWNIYQQAFWWSYCLLEMTWYIALQAQQKQVVSSACGGLVWPCRAVWK